MQKMRVVTCKVSLGGKGAWIAPKSKASGFTQRAMEDISYTLVNKNRRRTWNPLHKEISKHYPWHQNILPPFYTRALRVLGHFNGRMFPMIHCTASVISIATPPSWWKKLKQNNTVFYGQKSDPKWLWTWKNILELHLRINSLCKYQREPNCG